METDPIYYFIFYSLLFGITMTACIAAIWNLVHKHFENKEIIQLRVFLQNYIDGLITDKELTHKTLILFGPRKGERRLSSQMLISDKEATQLVIALDQLVDRHKTDDIKRLEYKLWRFANKEKASQSS
jgi:hypothetical protein